MNTPSRLKSSNRAADRLAANRADSVAPTTGSGVLPSALIAVALIAAVFEITIPTALAEEQVSVTDAIVTDHHYQFGLNSSVRAMQGSFDAYGDYHPFASGSKALNYNWNPSFSYRLSQLVEVGTSLPIRHSSMSFPTGTSSSWAINSPSVDTRLHLGGWPHLVVHIGASGPWKYRTMDMTGDPSASMPDDMGDGFTSGASVRIGAGVSRTLHPFRIALDISGTHPFASTNIPNDAPPGVQVPEVTTRQGDRLSLSEGLSFLISRRWTLNTGLRQYWAAPTIANSVIMEGTRGRSFSTNFGASFIPNSEWRINASFETQYPFYSYAVNLPYAPAVSLGMSYIGI